MAVLYPSQEWADAWRLAVNRSPAVEDLGKQWAVGFNGNFLFEILPDAGLKQVTYLYFVVSPGGKCSESRVVAGPHEAEIGFLASGPYRKFIDIISGKRDFIEVVLRGEIKMKGDMSKIMRHARYIRAVADCLSSVDSRYLEDGA